MFLHVSVRIYFLFFKSPCLPPSNAELCMLYIFEHPPPFSVKVSVAASKAGAASKSIPLWKHYAKIAGNLLPHTLPAPCFNDINGGEHAGNALAFQEFFVILTGAETFK